MPRTETFTVKISSSKAEKDTRHLKDGCTMVVMHCKKNFATFRKMSPLGKEQQCPGPR